jgi:hypothetical protein
MGREHNWIEAIAGGPIGAAAAIAVTSEEPLVDGAEPEGVGVNLSAALFLSTASTTSGP